MSDRARARVTLRRALSYTLIPLSTVPFVAAVPLVAPSVEHRLDGVSGQPAAPAGDRAEPLRPRAPLLRPGAPAGAPDADRPRRLARRAPVE